MKPPYVVKKEGKRLVNTLLVIHPPTTPCGKDIFVISNTSLLPLSTCSLFLSPNHPIFLSHADHSLCLHLHPLPPPPTVAVPPSLLPESLCLISPPSLSSYSIYFYGRRPSLPPPASPSNLTDIHIRF
jgi:hypothetical protein